MCKFKGCSRFFVEGKGVKDKDSCMIGILNHPGISGLGNIVRVGKCLEGNCVMGK